jgi:hypothetical protein
MGKKAWIADKLHGGRNNKMFKDLRMQEKAFAGLLLV